MAQPEEFLRDAIANTELRKSLNVEENRSQDNFKTQVKIFEEPTETRRSNEIKQYQVNKSPRDDSPDELQDLADVVDFVAQEPHGKSSISINSRKINEIRSMGSSSTPQAVASENEVPSPKDPGTELKNLVMRDSI